jgi:hypothetical protein
MHLARFILTIVLALPSSIYAATGPRLQIGYVSFVPGVAPLWVASDRRLFAQEGVDPELVFIGSAPTMLASMMAREVSLALTAGTAVMSAIAAGAPLKIFATFTNWLTVDLIARPGIARPEDLKGKRVGVQSIGGGIWMQALLALERLGLDPARDQLRLQVIGPQAQLAKALEAGVVDATVLPPAFSRPLKRRGFPVLLEGKNHQYSFDRQQSHRAKGQRRSIIAGNHRTGAEGTFTRPGVHSPACESAGGRRDPRAADARRTAGRRGGLFGSRGDSRSKALSRAGRAAQHQAHACPYHAPRSVDPS